MVGAIKRWLGIDVLERENLQLAKSLKSAHQRITGGQKQFAEAVKLLQDSQKSLTSEPSKPKLVAKPQRANWRAFKEQVERATEPEREEA